MTAKKRVRFWHLMVGTGFTLLAIGLVMIFLPPGVGDSDPFLIEFFEAKIEGSEMGLALIVLGLSCFLIGRKDLADLRAYQEVRQDLTKTSALTAKLVAAKVERTFHSLPARPTHLVSQPDLDVDETRRALKNLQNGKSLGQVSAQTILQAERGMELLQALEKEGFLT